MLLHEIIQKNEEDKYSILYELLHPYLKSLHTYYKDLFDCEPILMVVSVSNAAQYAKIVSSEDFEDSYRRYCSLNFEHGMTEKQFQKYFETVNFNSKFLSELIKS